jgi:hypothetical protein
MNAISNGGQAAQVASVGARFCPSCPASLILVRQPDGQVHEHTADPATGAVGDRHVCRGALPSGANWSNP